MKFYFEKFFESFFTTKKDNRNKELYIKGLLRTEHY